METSGGMESSRDVEPSRGVEPSDGVEPFEEEEETIELSFRILSEAQEGGGSSPTKTQEERVDDDSGDSASPGCMGTLGW